MDTSIISEVVLPLVFVGVGAVLIWFLVDAIQFLRRTRTTVETMEAQITPILKDVQEITDSIKPAVDKVDPLVERVSLAVDAANLEIMRLDGILENVDKIAETTASAASAVDTVANTPLKLVESATEKLRDAFAARKASDESASLAASAEASKASSIAAGPQDDAASGAAVKHAGTEAPEGSGDSGENYFTYAS